MPGLKLQRQTQTFLAQTLALAFIILTPQSDEDPDEVEELRVDSDMERTKDD